MSDEAPGPILAAITALREELRAEVVQTRTDLMARMDRLQDALMAQGDAGLVNYGAAERAERLARGAQEEARTLGVETRTLSEQMGAIVRQLRRLESEVRQLKGEAA